jgi:pseudaminic acid synthase
MSSFTFAGRMVGPEHPTLVIAELSANHNQDIDEAIRLIQAARQAGADAVKLQTYTPDTLTLKCERPEFHIGGGTLWDGRTLHDLYQDAYAPWDWHPRLKRAADEIGIPLFSTPFDSTAVAFLEQMNVPAYKVASFEIVDLPLIERIAQTGKPIILSTGMATLTEIAEAVDTARQAGAVDLALLKCTSAYPAPPEDMNLRTIAHLAAAFGVPAGVSDHTLGIAVPVTAVAVGACIVEKHLTLSRSRPGPDSAFSLEPQEFKEMVDAIRVAERALGRIQYGMAAHEVGSRMFRRSLFVVEDIKAGERLTERNVRSIRPGHGLAPKHWPAVLGRHAIRDVSRGTPLTWDLLA